MNAPPFGLSPMVFSYGVVILWLTVVPTIAYFVSKSRRKRMRDIAAATPQPAAAAPQAPVYPYTRPPEQPWADLIGFWQFKSAGRWIGVIIGVVFGVGVFGLPLEMAAPIGAACLVVIMYSLMRPTRSAQTCTVAPNLAITMGRGGRELSLDLRNYRYVRTRTSQARYGNNFPSMVIFDRDRAPGFGAMVSSIFFPRVDDGRIVVFHNRWYNAQANIISPNRIDDFFIDICRRAGYEPHFRKTWLTTGRPAWDAGANYS
jgi:hypothetical protein